MAIDARRIQSLINIYQPQGWDLSFEADSRIDSSVHISGIISGNDSDKTELEYPIAYEKDLSKFTYFAPIKSKLNEVINLNENIAKGLGAKIISVDLGPSQINSYELNGYSFPEELNKSIAVKKLK